MLIYEGAHPQVTALQAPGTPQEDPRLTSNPEGGRARASDLRGPEAHPCDLAPSGSAEAQPSV